MEAKSNAENVCDKPDSFVLGSTTVIPHSDLPLIVREMVELPVSKPRKSPSFSQKQKW